MKKLITTATVAVLASCSAVAEAAPIHADIKPQVAQARAVPAFEAIIAQAQYHRLTTAIAAAEQRVGRTWYVFSGDTPAGWDCSGLTRWVYEQAGITIPHSANKQGHLGRRVKAPRRGDLVLFGYPGTDIYYHAAIYLSANKILHAGFRRGMTTAILPLASPMLKGAKVIYVRVID